MKYDELRTKLTGLGMPVDRTIFFKKVDGGWRDRVEGVAYNVVVANDVRILATDGRGGFFQKPGEKTTFATVEDACDWIWRDVCFHEAPDLLSEEQKREVVAEAQASIDGLL